MDLEDLLAELLPCLAFAGTAALFLTLFLGLTP